jgi:small-conductance mechanosensitive channel
VSAFAPVRLVQEAAQLPPAPLADAIASLSLAPVVRTVVVVAIGVPLLYVAAKWTRRWVAHHMNLQAGLVAGKLVFYLGVTILAISTLREMGFSLAPLLGAAGVLGIALGFASQTSVSNVISGLFLIAERPFVVDDLIEVGGVLGRVMSIDTISVQLRTFDNRMVRIPNETLVKSQVINITRFPIRRVDVQVRVSLREDAARVRHLLLEIADRNPLSLMEPKPIVVFERFGESSMDFMLGIWTVQGNYLAIKNSIQEEIKRRFDAEGIQIPFPHRTIHVGSASETFPAEPPDGARRRSLDEPV